MLDVSEECECEPYWCRGDTRTHTHTHTQALLWINMELRTKRNDYQYECGLELPQPSAYFKPLVRP